MAVEDVELQAEEEPGAVGEFRRPGSSVLEHVRARREEIARSETPTLTLPVPGDTALGVRYRYPEGGAEAVIKAYEQALARAQKSGKSQDIPAASRLISLCCDEVVGRMPESEEWQSLDGQDERPLRFNQRLADLLGIEVAEGAKPSDQTRAIVRHVFSPRAQHTGVFDGDMALLDQAGEVLRWLRTGLEDAGERLEGE